MGRGQWSMQRGAKGGRHRDLWPSDAPGIQLLVKTVSSPACHWILLLLAKRQNNTNKRSQQYVAHVCNNMVVVMTIL